MSGVAFSDLLEADQSDRSVQSDVCVIGAGAAGIYLAVQLAAKGLDVILLEAGGSLCGDASELGFEAVFSNEFYPGATKGRYFGLGGSTSRWGGVLVPHTRHDLREEAETDSDPWSHIVNEVSENSDKVLENLGRRGPGRFAEFAREVLGEMGRTLNAAGLDVVASLSLPFRKRNLSFLLNGKGVSRSRIRVFLNAVARSWTFEAGIRLGAKVCRLSAVAHNGNSLNVAASRFVVAAGAIESARILLEIESTSSHPVLRPAAAVGCYLSDHLSVSIADVGASSLHDTVRLFAPRFSQGWMRSFRFMEADPPTTAPRAFAHFIFDIENPGFTLAKEVLGAIQSRRWPQLSASDVVSGIGGLVALAYARYIRSTLYIPPSTKTHLQLDIDQTPARENRISLGSEKDKYGRRIPDIRWGISDVDLINIKATAERLLSNWPCATGRLPKLIPGNFDCNVTKPHDAYHPVGSCRMGSDSEAVVDQDLKVWGVENMWVISTGVLPNAGTANPTFTMLCLAESLVEHLTNTALPINHV